VLGTMCPRFIRHRTPPRPHVWTRCLLKGNPRLLWTTVNLAIQDAACQPILQASSLNSLL
ncbi:MAG: hypothetical protein LBH03_04175, partial [Holophagales bacterium]|nr:hypothetical protein [Holophagales bacterium]